MQVVSRGVPQWLREIAEHLAHLAVSAYLVGGCVRDLLVGREIADLDLAVPDPVGVGGDLSRALGGKFVLMDEANHVCRVVLPPPGLSGRDRHVDLSPVRGSIEEDLAQRDFTVNAMAIPSMSVLGGTSPVAAIIDPFDGRGDLERRTLRALNDGVFQADALRLLRAVRIAGELGLVLDAKTEALVRRDYRLIAGVSGERVREEFFRVLSAPGAAGALEYLDRLSLLTAIIPELAAAKGVEQPKEHHWDVFRHCIETVRAVEGVLGVSRWEHADPSLMELVPTFPSRSSHFDEEIACGASRLTLLKLAAVLHDVAKPQTKMRDEKGRTRFLGHPVLGAEVGADILERLRCSNRETKLVTTVIKYHLRPGQMSQDGMPTRRAMYRFFRDAEGAGIDVLYLNLADFLASRGPDIEAAAWREFTEIVSYALSYYQDGERGRPVKLVDGNDLMETFGLKPGPELGRILEQVREAQGAGEIGSREEALELVRRILS